MQRLFTSLPFADTALHTRSIQHSTFYYQSFLWWFSPFDISSDHLSTSQILRQVLARTRGESQGHRGAGDASAHKPGGGVQRVQGKIPVHAGDYGDDYWSWLYIDDDDDWMVDDLQLKWWCRQRMSLGTAVETLATVKMVSSRVQTTRRNTPLMTLVSVNSEWSTKSWKYLN